MQDDVVETLADGREHLMPELVPGRAAPTSVTILHAVATARSATSRCSRMPRSLSRTVLGGETEARAREAAVVGVRRAFRRLSGLNIAVANSNPDGRATSNWHR